MKCLFATIEQRHEIKPVKWVESELPGFGTLVDARAYCRFVEVSSLPAICLNLMFLRICLNFMAIPYLYFNSKALLFLVFYI